MAGIKYFSKLIQAFLRTISFLKNSLLRRKIPQPQCGVGYKALDNNYASCSSIQEIYRIKTMK